MFMGKLPRSVQPSEMVGEIKLAIARQQTQFTPDINNDPNRIDVVDHAYTQAEPDCWLAYAQWKLVL